MECFQVRYDSRVVIYEHKLFIRLARELIHDVGKVLVETVKAFHDKTAIFMTKHTLYVDCCNIQTIPTAKATLG